MKAAFTEKRIFPRINLKLPFRYRIVGSKDVYASRLRDISVGGIGFVSEKFIPSSTNMRLEIGIPLKIINLMGRVVWSCNLSHSDRYRIGVEFTKISYKDRCNLADYLNGHLFNLLKKG
ncbi:MAG: PilZ domain-containing protein [Candidatus Omnitrophica bacterium]|nr:PilZ domain-containing protein [Candidatus Omnitrophota bacterium]MCM8770424.1 PilZ domain-containing protein [Candidatus Omnitrophota bacterium]